MIKVSIIIPCYNQAHFLPDAIESALAQTYPYVEVIVVNDGSPDNTSHVVRQLRKRKSPGYSTIKLIEKPNGGLSSARNAGIAAATGEYILPLDADDKIHPDFITKTIGIDDIVSTGLHTFGQESRAWITDVAKPEYQNFIQRNHINCCSLFKKEIWTAIGGYDEQMRDGFEDWDFWNRATKAGYTVTIVREWLFYYRKHSVSMFADAMRKRTEIIEYMHRKYSPSGQLIDVVYALGTGSQTGDQELRYSLRSLERFCTGYRRIYIIGVIPAWIRDIYHQRYDDGSIKAINILNKITSACRIQDLTDEFLFVNDDHFFLRPTDIPSYPYYHSNADRATILKDRAPADYYHTIITETMALAPTADYYDIHKPIRYNKNTFLDMVRDIDFTASSRGLLIKSMYCHYAGITGTECRDTVLRTPHTPEQIRSATTDTDVMSITNTAINSALVSWLADTYPIKSKYER